MIPQAKNCDKNNHSNIRLEKVKKTVAQVGKTLSTNGQLLEHVVTYQHFSKSNLTIDQ